MTFDDVLDHPGPLLAAWQVGLDLLWTGVVGGSVAYAIYRVRGTRK